MLRLSDTACRASRLVSLPMPAWTRKSENMSRSNDKPGTERSWFLAALPVGVRLVGEGAAGDVVGEGGGRLGQDGGQVGVLLDELGGPRRQAGHVLPDQDLGVAARAGPDADGGDGQRLGHPGGQRLGHAL